MKKSFIGLAPLAALLPFVVSAGEATTSAAVVPVGMVSADASELASFALSVVALVVAGIALSRTGKRHH